MGYERLIQALQNQLSVVQHNRQNQIRQPTLTDKGVLLPEGGIRERIQINSRPLGLIQNTQTFI